MAETQQVAVRLYKSTVRELDVYVSALQQLYPRGKFNRSDVVRAAIIDYLRRNQ